MRRTALLALACALAAPYACAQARTSCSVQPATPVTEADKAFAAGDFAKAESLYAAGKDDHASIGLVHTLLEEHKLADALKAAQDALTARPSATTLALQGEALLRDGQVTEATAPISKAVADSCSPRALYMLATYNNLIAKRASAAQQLASAHRLDPSDAQITAAWAVTLAPDAQAAALQALLASSPILPPRVLPGLTAAQTFAAGHKTCTASWPEKPVKLDLFGITTYGIHPRSFGIKTRVGNADIATTELDSSVSGIVLNPNDARRAGVHPIGTGTPAPGSTYYYAVADVIHVGPAEFHDCPVRVSTSDGLGGANSLIGTDFFRDRLIHIDYVDRSVTLTAPATAATGLTDRAIPASEKDWSVAYMAGENILIPTMINKKGPYLMLLDTGVLVGVYAPLIGDGKPIAYKDSLVPIRGSSTDIIKIVPQLNGGDPNETRLYGPDNKRLGIGVPIKLPNLVFYGNGSLDLEPFSFDITPKSQEVGLELAGLLSFGILKDFTLDIDYRNGVVHLVYDQLHRYSERELGSRQ